MWPEAQRHSQLDMIAKLWVSSQPLMEVADRSGSSSSENGGAGSSRYSVYVHSECEATSRVVAELLPFTQFRILLQRTSRDGARRANIVVDGIEKPLGWLTIVSKDGAALAHLYARPLYEVVSPVKVHRHFETTSRLIANLAVGTRLHVIESRQAADRTQRVCALVCGDDRPIGWITARRPDLPRAIAEVAGLPSPFLKSASSRPGGVVVGNAMSDAARTHGAQSSAGGGKRLWGRAALAAMKSMAAAAPAAAAPQQPRKAPIAGVEMLDRDGGAKSARAPSRPRHKTLLAAKAAGEAYQLSSLAEVTRAAVAVAKASKVTHEATSVASSSSGGGGKGAAGPAGGGGGGKADRKQAEKLQMKTAQDLLKQVGKYASSSELEAIASQHEATAQSEEDGAAAAKPMAARVGEKINARKVKIPDLIKEWDPSGDGSISKMEFRQAVRAYTYPQGAHTQAALSALSPRRLCTLLTSYSVHRRISLCGGYCTGAQDV